MSTKAVPTARLHLLKFPSSAPSSALSTAPELQYAIDVLRFLYEHMYGAFDVVTGLNLDLAMSRGYIANAKKGDPQ